MFQVAWLTKLCQLPSLQNAKGVFLLVSVSKGCTSHAARLVLRKSRHASATALLRTLHWLPVKARIHYKIACLCFQCIYQNSVPPYISDLLHPYCPSRMLRSLDTSLLTVPRFSLETFGKRSSLFLDPLSGTHYHYPSEKHKCFTNFKTKLKTHLFRTHLC